MSDVAKRERFDPGLKQLCLGWRPWTPEEAEDVAFFNRLARLGCGALLLGLGASLLHAKLTADLSLRHPGILFCVILLPVGLALAAHLWALAQPPSDSPLREALVSAGLTVFPALLGLLGLPALGLLLVPGPVRALRKVLWLDPLLALPLTAASAVWLLIFTLRARARARQKGT